MEQQALPEKGADSGCLGIGEEGAEEKGKGDEGVAPHEQEDDLQPVVCQPEELEVDGGCKQEEHQHVGTIYGQEPAQWATTLTITVFEAMLLG